MIFFNFQTALDQERRAGSNKNKTGLRPVSRTTQELVINQSSLHWYILGFLLCLFMQWKYIHLDSIKSLSSPLKRPFPMSYLIQKATILEHSK